VILLEWSEFATRFARELSGLGRDTILIVREHNESRHYVQAMRESERLYAEAVSNNFLEGPLALTPADEEVLAEAGWRPPTADWSPANWWTELSPAAPPGAHAGLAEMMVTALRDVQGVRRPADLVYESFHRDGFGLIELMDLGIAPADPARVTERRRTADAAEPSRPSRADQVLAAPTPPPQPSDRPAGEAVGQRPERPEGPEGPLERPPEGPAEALAAPLVAGLAALAGRIPGQAPPPPYEPSEGESRLVDALRSADAATCYELFLTADLVLSATGQAVEDPSLAEFTTAVVDGETRVLAYTSPQAMARALGDRAVLHRKISFRDLASAWPDPQWSLVINSGLPSEVRVDAVTVARLDEMRRTAESASTVDALVSRAADKALAPGGERPAASLSASDRRAIAPAAARVLPVPHGAELWRLADETPDGVPVAKYDAAEGRWIATESLPQVRP
jgi:hypothetical protein